LQYLPNAVLAAVVFVIGVKLIDYKHMIEIARLRRDEFVIATITAVVVVCVGVEQGILLAIVLSLLDHVRRHYDPRDAVVTMDGTNEPVEVPAEPGARTEPGLVVYRFGVGLFYANASRLTTEAIALVDVDDPPKWFVLQADAIDDVDFTGGMTLVDLAQQLSDRKIVFAVADAQPQVQSEFERFGLIKAIGPERVFATLVEAIAAFHASKGADAQ